MTGSKAGKNIWSRITLDDLVEAIASLGDRTDHLKGETWRLNIKTKLPDSLWSEVIQKLNLDDSETTRHSLYKLWQLKRHNIDQLIIVHPKKE